MFSNLPIEMTSFIGREREIVEVSHLLGGARLLTLTGPGGCGKTRLALQVAAATATDYADGVTLVELATLTDAALVPSAVLAALGMREEVSRPVGDTLTDHLRPRSCLLVLDNCEHLLDAVAMLAESLLRTCQGLRILATSRQSLGIGGETAWRVLPLTVPPETDVPSSPAAAGSAETYAARGLLAYETVRLFVDRATTVNPGFHLTDENAAAVVEICRRLDGIPLAIELAAARIKALTAAQIAARLDDRFQLLTTGSRTAVPRQQTLRGTIDWSYELLSEPERMLLRRMSVFVGGWTLEAAEEAVCRNDERDGLGETVPRDVVLDLITGLIEQSLVLSEEEDGAAHYHLLETVRQYALERLEASGEEQCARAAHAERYLRLADETYTELRGPAGKRALDRLDAEHDNLRSALNWLAEHDVERGLRLAGALWEFWEARGHLAEGYRRLTALLAAPSAHAPTRARARALSGHSLFARVRGDYAAARRSAEECLEVRRVHGDRAGIAHALSGLGIVARATGDYTRARALHEESLAIMRETDDRWGVAKVLNNLGNVLERLGDYDDARARHEESLTIRRLLGDRRSIAMSLDNLGVVVQQQGDHRAARVLHEEALTIRRELGDPWSLGFTLKTLSEAVVEQGDLATAGGLLRESLATMWRLGDREAVAECLEGLAALAGAQGEPSTAGRLFGAAEALRGALGKPVDPPDRPRYDRDVATARAQLDPSAFAAAWADGRGAPLDEVIAGALSETEAGARAGKATERGDGLVLSAREREVALLLAQGLTNRQIADDLVVARSTVDRHVVNILRKLDLTSRAQVAVWAVEHRLESAPR